MTANFGRGRDGAFLAGAGTKAGADIKTMAGFMLLKTEYLNNIVRFRYGYVQINIPLPTGVPGEVAVCSWCTSIGVEWSVRFKDSVHRE